MNQPPSGSVFQIEENFDGRKILIPKPKRKLADIGAIAFLCFWLCGWAVGEVFVIYALLGMIQDSEFNGSSIFLIAWLGGWTVGGFFAMRQVYNLVQGEPPESITIGISQIIHGKKKSRTYQKNEITKVGLETSDNSHSLYIDVGADRIYIGEHLREPEREWLHSIIKDWKGI
jgi:hypothetical protein